MHQSMGSASAGETAMKVGDELPPLTIDVGEAEIAELAAILRDPNPIHLDPAAVRAAGLGDRVVNQGPANLAYILNMLEAAFPLHRLDSLESRYLANVRAGDRAEAGGAILAIEDDTIDCEVWLKVEDKVAVGGKARLTPR